MNNYNKRVFSEFIKYVKNYKNGHFTYCELKRFMKQHKAGFMIAPGWWIRDWIESAKMRGELIEIAPREYVFSDFYNNSKLENSINDENKNKRNRKTRLF